MVISYIFLYKGSGLLKINKSINQKVKHVKGIVDFSTWMEENPYFLEQTLFHDIISFGSMQ